jgi:hypothetical protein
MTISRPVDERLRGLTDAELIELVEALAIELPRRGVTFTPHGVFDQFLRELPQKIYGYRRHLKRQVPA